MHRKWSNRLSLNQLRSRSMVGTLVGTLLIGVINNALNLFRVDAEWQNVAKGFIIFLAVLFDAVKNRMKQAE